MLKLTLLTILSVSMLQACSLFPYEDKFGCNRPDNLGKCISPAEAYEEITSGQSTHPHMQPYSEQNKDEKNNGRTQKAPTPPPITVSSVHPGYDQYLDSSYSKIAGLLNEPVTPVIKPVQTAEMLILPYSDTANILKGERYIHVILETPKFILGDYLKKQPIHLKSLFNE